MGMKWEYGLIFSSVEARFVSALVSRQAPLEINSKGLSLCQQTVIVHFNYFWNFRVFSG
jgi:hypothetical protein